MSADAGPRADGATAAATEAVRVRDLVLDYPADDGALRAVAGFDLRVGVGEFVCLIGPSGCGKSTVLRVLAGLLAPSAGDVNVFGDPADARRHAAWMPQTDSLLPWRRAVDNAALGAQVTGRSKSESRRLAAQVLEQFGLGDYLRSWPHQLSGGMRQRLALARTVLADRPILLLDEPFGALDPILRRSMARWLASATLTTPSSGRPITVVMVTHDLDEALLVADRIVVSSPRPARVVGEYRLRRSERGAVADAAEGVRREVLAILDQE